MTILLAGPDHEENLSIRYLSAALLNAGYDTVLASFNSPTDIVPVAEAAESAQIVGLSMCFQSRAMQFLRVAQLIKSRDPNKLIVAGGHYASCAAEALLTHHPELDLIVIHEGERTLVEIADAGPRLHEFLPQIPGIAYRDKRNRVCFTPRRPMQDNLDALPFPDRRGPIRCVAGVPTSYLMGSRGCFGQCAYCCITTLHELAPGKRFRQRNVEGIAAEMAALYHNRGTRRFVFHDDNFLVPSEPMNLARISALSRSMDSRGVGEIALVVKCRPADASVAVLRRLKQMGLVRVFLGIESSTPRGLSCLERCQTVDDSARALDACAELGISAQFTIMTFNPDATLDTMRSDLAFMRRYCRNPLNFCRTEIYAGIPLEKRMNELGRARGNYLASVYNLSEPAADLACKISLDLFESRCWSDGSLMQHAIGLDHLAALAKRFYRGTVATRLSERVSTWVRSVNLDTLDLLDEVLALSTTPARGRNAGLERAISNLRDRETAARRRLLAEGLELRAELDALRFSTDTYQVRPLAPLRTQADLMGKKKPFTYFVGEANDQDSLKGIADVVYGDSNDWLPIFEANRKVMAKPSLPLPYETELVIPPRQRAVPKLLSKISPAYPRAAMKEGIWGEVLLDVTLKNDGTVAQIATIDGPPILVTAATEAVKQWRSRPSWANGKAVRFVVVVSFSKSGKIR